MKPPRATRAKKRTKKSNAKDKISTNERAILVGVGFLMSMALLPFSISIFHSVMQENDPGKLLGTRAALLCAHGLVSSIPLWTIAGSRTIIEILMGPAKVRSAWWTALAVANVMAVVYTILMYLGVRSAAEDVEKDFQPIMMFTGLVACTGWVSFNLLATLTLPPDFIKQTTLGETILEFLSVKKKSQLRSRTIAGAVILFLIPWFFIIYFMVLM